MKKRAIAILLTIILLFTAFPFSVLATGGKPKASSAEEKNKNAETTTVLSTGSDPTLVVSSGEACPGDKIELTVTILNNPGINTFSFGFDYDASVLQLMDVVASPNIDGQFIYEKKAVWLNSSDIFYNGTILNLFFNVLPDAVLGETEVKLQFKTGDITDYNENDIPFFMNPGIVTIRTKQPIVKLGDVNFDGKINSTDARITLRAAAKVEELSENQQYAADINSDGKIKAADARTILRVAAKLESLPDSQSLSESPSTEPTIEESQKSLLTIDENIFVYDESTDKYSLVADIISGRAEKSVASVDFQITDDKDIVICKGSADLEDGQWSIENFSFRDGNNKLTISAIEKEKAPKSVLSFDIVSSAFVNQEYSLIDTTIDTDKDGLIDYLEQYYESDPNATDTDDDGLSDYFEVYYLGYCPNNNDTDKNGINDADEDYDNDGLCNLKEQEIGTNPAFYDTDHDSVSDYDEIELYHTDPSKDDSDGDGVVDGIEIANGSDPLTEDSSFVETIYPSAVDENNTVSAGVSVVTDSKGAGSLTISKVWSGENPFITSTIPGYLGSAYNFTVEGELKSAMITFEYDEHLGKIGENFQPRIYYVNEASGELEELENQVIEKGRVKAPVEHFSTYILLNKIEYDKVWDSEIKTPNTEGSGVRELLISFVIDSSGSMAWNDPTGLRKELTNNFIDKMVKEDRASVIDFDSYARVNSDFTNNKEELKIAVNWIDSSGGTNMYLGLSQSLELFKNISNCSDDALKIVFLLTDGSDDGSGGYYSEAEYMELVYDCVANGIQVYTVGLGEEVNSQLLEEIALTGNGKYYFAERDLDLISGFNKVQEETIDYITDSNNDGLSDYYTKLIDEGTLVLSNGSIELFGVLSLYGAASDDWDNDGLKNGEEIEVVQGKYGPSLKMISNPIHPDTDYDGYDDYTERFVMKTDPLKKTYYGGLMLQNLMDDGMSTSSLIGNQSLWEEISLSAYTDKKKDSKNKLADFFYKYASEESIQANADAIRKAEIRSSIFDTIEMLTNLAKLGKGVADLAEKYEVNQDTEKGNEAFKASVRDVEKQRGIAIEASNSTNESKWEKFLKKEGDILDAFSSWDSYLRNLNDIIEGRKESVPGGSVDYDSIIAEINNDAKIVTSAISAVKNSVGLFKLWRAGTKPIGNTLTKVSEYTAKTSAKDAFSLTTGDFIDIGFAVVDYANEVMDIADTYAKVQANSDAFIDYYDLLDYIACNNRYDYVRDAANEVLALALGGSAEYWEQLEKAASAQFAKDFIKEVVDLGLNAAGKANPVILVLKVVLDIALDGLNAVYKVEIEATTVAAITDACKHFLYQCASVTPDGTWYEVLEEKETEFKHYLVHLVHGRIDGEYIVYTHCDDIGIFSKSFEGWRYLFTGRNRIQETKDNCLYIIQQVYKRANFLDVKYSKQLPFYHTYHTLTF